MKPDEKQKKVLKWVSFRTFVCLVLLVGAIHLLTYVLLMNFAHSWDERSHFGEMFGITHSVFDGLAFVALLFTILLQQSELVTQKDETKRNASIQKTLVEVLGITAQLNAQYSLLDSRNRAHDRSITDNVPAERRSKEEEGIAGIEKDISKSIDDLHNLLNALKTD